MNAQTKTSSSKKSGNGSKKPNAPTTEQAVRAAHDALDTAAEKLGPVEDRVRKESAKSKETLKVKSQEAKDEFEVALTKVEDFARERPLAAAGIAFAAGIIASAILRR